MTLAAPSPLERLGLLLDADRPAAIRRIASSARASPGYGTVDVGSGLIRYREHGEGDATYVFAADPPIVLEHYDRLLDALSPNGRVVVLELPGFGFSPVRAGFDFSMEGVMRAVHLALERLGVAKATLCFPCGSAYLAIALAAHAPGLVESLLLSQAPSFEGVLGWKRGRDPSGLLARPLFGQCAMHFLKRSRAPMWFAVSVGKETERGWMLSLTERTLRDGARWSLASAFQRFLVEGGAPPPAPCPVVALWGTLDRSHARTDRESSRSLGPDVRLVQWDDVGHFPDLEEPERFAALARSLRS